MNKSATRLNSVTVVGCDLKGNGIDIEWSEVWKSECVESGSRIVEYK